MQSYSQVKILKLQLKNLLKNKKKIRETKKRKNTFRIPGEMVLRSTKTDVVTSPPSQSNVSALRAADKIKEKY